MLAIHPLMTTKKWDPARPCPADMDEGRSDELDMALIRP